MTITPIDGSLPFLDDALRARGVTHIAVGSDSMLTKDELARHAAAGEVRAQLGILDRQRMGLASATERTRPEWLALIKVTEARLAAAQRMMAEIDRAEADAASLETLTPMLRAIAGRAP